VRKGEKERHDTHLKDLFALDRRETNKFNQRFPGRLVLIFGRGRRPKSVVGDIGPVALKRRERKGVPGVVVSNEA
jgi:hypothetical protein